MKKLILLGILGVIGFLPYRASAQISVNLNIGSQPLWGPVGYDYVDYYYLPDIESYYNVSNRQFIYMDGGRWIFSTSLPSRYRGYDLYSGYKVVVNSRDPYRNFDSDRIRYSRYRSVRTQSVIRYSHDPRYYVVKGHPYAGRRVEVRRDDPRMGGRDQGRWDRDDRREHDNRRDRDDRGGRDHGRDRGNNGRGNDRGNGRH